MENKSKKVGGKVILIVVVIILIATATYYVMLKQEQAKVEQNIETIFNALKSGAIYVISRRKETWYNVKRKIW